MEELKDINTEKKDEEGSIEWDFAVPIFTNRFFYQDCMMTCIMTLLSCAVLFGAIDLLHYLKKGHFISMPLYTEYTLFAIVFFGVIIASTTLLTLIVTRNRYRCHFTVNREGASMKGIIARQTRLATYRWERIAHVIPYPKLKAIALYNSWRRVMVLYCPENRYEEILQIALNGVWRTEEARRARTELAKKRFLNSALWTLFLLIMAQLASEAPLIETDAPAWLLFALCMLATITGGMTGRIIGLCNLFILTVLAIIMIHNGLKMQYSGLGLFAYNFFHNLVYTDYLIFFILSMSGFAGFVAYSWRVILEGRGSLPEKGHEIKTLKGFIYTGLFLMLVIASSVLYAAIWQAFEYENASQSLPKTFKRLVIGSGDSREVIEFKKSYNELIDAYERYRDAKGQEKHKAFAEYRRLRPKVFEKQQRMIESMSPKKETVKP